MTLPDNKKVSKKIILIDVSNLFFRAFYAVPPHFTDREGNQSNAVYGVASVIFSILEREQGTHLFAAKDLREKTHRHKALEVYKAGRPKMPDELAQQIPRVYSFFEDALGLPLLSSEGYEADDVIATVAEHFRGKEDTEVNIISADHDLFQLIGENIFVLLPQNGGKPALKMDAEKVQEKIGVSPLQVPDYKSLAGDASDKLAGVPGIGPKGACRLIDEYKTTENILQNREKVTGKTGALLEEYHEQALFMKEMAMLHRDLPFPFTEEEGKINGMPKNLIPFLENLSSRNLITRAKKVFGDVPDDVNQLGLF